MRTQHTVFFSDLLFKTGGGIHEFSDSQFGHLFSRGATRAAAIRSMLLALKDIRIRGEIRTNVDYACEMLVHPDFVENVIHTVRHTGGGTRGRRVDTFSFRHYRTITFL